MTSAPPTRRASLGRAHRVVDAHPNRQSTRRAVLVERLRVDTVRIPLHDQRPIGQHREHAGGAADVVPEQVAFGQLQLRPEGLREITDLEAAASGQQQYAVTAPVLDRVELIEQPFQGRATGEVGRATWGWWGEWGECGG